MVRFIGRSGDRRIGGLDDGAVRIATVRIAFLPILFSSLLTISIAACDVVEPPAERLVVEAFVEAGEGLPEVIVRRSARLDDPDAAPPIADAEVVLEIAGETVGYAPVGGSPGRYRPSVLRVAGPGERFGLEVAWQGRRATASSALPAPIALDSVRIEPADAPVAAVFADSLGLELEEGFIYPVDVTLFWTAPPEDTAWVRTQLRPPASFPSAVVDFLLATGTIEREREFPGAGAVRRWSGVYAVPVETAADPLPSHDLDVALLRSGEDYARYALSRTDPDRRDPDGNVEGGLGIAAGIALDRRTITVE